MKLLSLVMLGLLHSPVLADSSSDALFEVAHKEQLHGYFGSAISHFSQLIVDEPNDSSLYALRGQCYSETGQDKLALRDFDQALLLRPVCVQCMIDRAVVLGSLGRKKEAVSAWRKVVLLEPFSQEIMSYQGMAELRAGYYKDAAESFKKAISIQPTYNDCYHLAELMRKKGKFGEADILMQKGRDAPGNGTITNSPNSSSSVSGPLDSSKAPPVEEQFLLPKSRFTVH